MSDMDSECDDVFTDDSKGTPLAEDDRCNLTNRKRRRGIIEKRRRDRINSSLSELRRLVPAAFEKQGSAKLEKAEILQMTVDHLKILHSKGVDPFGFDSHHFAMDYHGIGFRECAAEVARYLVGMEGLDLQDPLRMRLLSHLQCFSAQRDLALKTSTSSSPWSPLFNSMAVAPTSQYPPGQTLSSPQSDRTSYSGGYSTSLSDERHSRSSSSMSSEPSVSSPRFPPFHPATSHKDTTTSPRATMFVSDKGTGRFQTSPRDAPRPYRPWGTELAY